MNSSTNAMTVNYFLEPDWVEVIEEHISTYPTAIALVVEPGLMGQFEAEQGRPREPLRYYSKLADIEAYIIAHKDTTTLLEMAADLADYRDEIEWIRGGC